jgi:uncharacterized membrane protein
MKRTVLIAMIVLSLIGLADSLYLAQHKADGTPLLCNIENLSGCNVVANSAYSYLFGIPLAEFGVVFYAVMLLLALFEYFFSHIHARRLLHLTALLGIISSAYFMYVQLFLIKALCVYCIGSAIIALILFGCMVHTFFDTEEEPTPPAI